MLLSGIYYGKTPITKAYKSGAIIWSSGTDKDFSEQIIAIQAEFLAYITTDALRLSLAENDICISCNGSLNAPTLVNKYAIENIVLNTVADVSVERAYDLPSSVPMLILPKAMMQFADPQNTVVQSTISSGGNVIGGVVEPNDFCVNVDIRDDSTTNLSSPIAQKECSMAEIVMQPYMDAYASILNKLSLLSKTILQNEIYASASESVGSKAISHTNIESDNLAHSAHVVPNFAVDNTTIDRDVNVNADESVHGIAQSHTHLGVINELNASVSQLEHIDENMVATIYAPISSDKTEVEQAQNDIRITNEIINYADLVRAGKSHNKILMDLQHKASVDSVEAGHIYTDIHYVNDAIATINPTQANEVQEDIAIHLEHEATPVQSTVIVSSERLMPQMDAELYADATQGGGADLGVLSSVDVAPNSVITCPTDIENGLRIIGDYITNVSEAVQNSFNLSSGVYPTSRINSQASRLGDACDDVKINTSSKAVPIILSYMQQSNDIQMPFHAEVNMDDTSQSDANDKLNMVYVAYGVIGPSKNGDIVMPLLLVPHGDAATPASICLNVDKESTISYESVVSAVRTVLQQYDNGVFVNANNDISIPDTHHSNGINYLLINSSAQASLPMSHISDVYQNLMMDVKDTNMHVPVLICSDVGTLVQITAENIASMSDTHDFESLYNAIVSNIVDVSTSDVHNICPNENVAIVAYNIAIPADLHNESILLNVRELFSTDVAMGVVDKIDVDGTVLLSQHNVVAVPNIYAFYVTTNIADTVYANITSKPPHENDAINEICLDHNNIMLARLPYSVSTNSEIALNGDSEFCICLPIQMQNDLSQVVARVAFLCKFESKSLYPSLCIDTKIEATLDTDVELIPPNPLSANDEKLNLRYDTTLTMGNKWIYPVQQNEDLYVVQALRSTLTDNVLKLI